MFTVNKTDGAVIATDQTFTDFTVLSDAAKAIPNVNTPIQQSYGISYEKARNRYLVTDYTQQAIFAVDAITGMRSVFSSVDVGTGDSFDSIGAGQLAAIVIDEQNQRAIVTQGYSEKMIFTIDLANGNRTLLSGVSPSNLYNYDQFNGVNQFFGLVIADPNSYAFVADGGLGAVLAIDLITGQRVIFSKN